MAEAGYRKWEDEDVDDSYLGGCFAHSFVRLFVLLSFVAPWVLSVLQIETKQPLSRCLRPRHRQTNRKTDRRTMHVKFRWPLTRIIAHCTVASSCLFNMHYAPARSLASCPTLSLSVVRSSAQPLHIYQMIYLCVVGRLL